MKKGDKKSLKSQPWHRWPMESEAAFALFRLYLEMGEERSLVKVMEESGRKYGLIASLSGKFKWPYRAREYDSYVYNIQETTVEKTLQKDAIIYAQRRSIYRNKEYSIATKLLEQAELMLAAPLYEQEIVEKVIVAGQEVPTKIIVKPVRWNKNTARAYVNTAAEILRLNLEMETQRVSVVHSNADDQNVRLQMARASLDHWTKNIDQLVDQQLQANPKLNRQEVTQEILKQLPLWCAADHKLTPEQIPLLTTGLEIQPLSNAFIQPPDDDVLPLPMEDEDLEPENDLAM
jgi:hypothetical protein